MACPVSWGAITTECQPTLRRYLKRPNSNAPIPFIVIIVYYIYMKTVVVRLYYANIPLKRYAQLICAKI
jgi:hypothetical protein